VKSTKSKEQGANAKQKNNKKQEKMQKDTKNCTLTRKKTLLAFVFFFSFPLCWVLCFIDDWQVFFFVSNLMFCTLLLLSALFY
jgi:hypothetical protein